MNTPALISIYFVSIVAANLLVAGHPERSPYIAFLIIGLILIVRDRLHCQWEGRSLALRMGSLIVAAGALSFALQPMAGRIAIASVAAFVTAEVLDSAAFHWLREMPWFKRSNLSNLPSAAADSAIFILVAFGPLWGLIALQFFAKLAGGFVWSAVLAPRHRRATQPLTE